MVHLPAGHNVSSPQIDTVNVYACTVIGYLVYSLAQVFLFCFFGNRLIEEVMFCFLKSLKLLESLHRPCTCSRKVIKGGQGWVFEYQNRRQIMPSEFWQLRLAEYFELECVVNWGPNAQSFAFYTQLFVTGYAVWDSGTQRTVCVCVQILHFTDVS